MAAFVEDYAKRKVKFLDLSYNDIHFHKKKIKDTEAYKMLPGPMKLSSKVKNYLLTLTSLSDVRIIYTRCHARYVVVVNPNKKGKPDAALY